LGFWQSGTIESVLTGWHRDAFSIDVPGGPQRLAWNIVPKAVADSPGWRFG
jgi:hypothetical protein